MTRNVKIAPSVLSADFSKIGEEVVRIEKAGADIVHLDVMDGVFVPNITFGIKLVKDMRKVTKLPFDCHLMIVNPEKYVEQFALAGADYITVHYEACRENTANVLKQIKALGVKAGVVINPNTDVELIDSFRSYYDEGEISQVSGFNGLKIRVKHLACSRHAINSRYYYREWHAI